VKSEGPDVFEKMVYSTGKTRANEFAHATLEDDNVCPIRNDS
jgi:hypothetical protein